jgi:hypothetical protein
VSPDLECVMPDVRLLTNPFPKRLARNWSRMNPRMRNPAMRDRKSPGSNSEISNVTKTVPNRATVVVGTVAVAAVKNGISGISGINNAIRVKHANLVSQRNGNQSNVRRLIPRT